MKKYKLIKEYPGSPKLGTIGYINKDFTQFKNKGAIYYSSNIAFFEDYPEFWEEIKEREYQILSFYAKNISSKGDTYVDNDYIWFPYSNYSDRWSRLGHITAPYTTKELLENPNYSILSVKRLSDGEVFTIGDKVILKYGVYNDPCIIGSMKIINKTICLRDKNNTWQSDIISIEKAKQKLFTTEDGVDLYLGDKIFYIENWGINESKVTDKGKANKDHPIEHWYSDFKYFSTKEKAEEYIIMNKPCLSLSDILKVYNIDICKLSKFGEELLIDLFTKEIKKKLGYEGSPIK